MRRSRFLALAGAAGLAALLGGCSGFVPVYGDMAAGPGSARFHFAAPGNRAEQIILNRLRTAFPQPAGPGDPTLAVTATEGGQWRGISDAFPAGRPVGVAVSASVRITQGDTELFAASRSTDTAYRSGGTSLAERASRDGAMETAARSTAEALRAAILAGYRPGTAIGIGAPRR